MKTITVYKGIPPQVADLDPLELLDWLTGPTFFFLNMNQKKTVLIVGLLHGNEPAGYYAIVNTLKRLAWTGQRFPFNILFFLGNVEAAKTGKLFSHRYLDTQQDFNRIWNAGTEHALARGVLAELGNYDIIGGLDVHNNTGLNPLYSIVTHLRPEILELADYLTDRHFVYTVPNGTLIHRLTEDGKQFVGVECGKRMDEKADKNALHTVERALDYFSRKIARQRLSVQRGKMYHKPLPVHVRSDVDFAIGAGAASFVIRADLEHFNFQELPSGTVLGTTSLSSSPLSALDSGKDVTSDWLHVENGIVVLKRNAVIMMATTDETNIRKDCLLYLAEELCETSVCPDKESVSSLQEKKVSKDEKLAEDLVEWT